jgi:hypothetical protein
LNFEKNKLEGMLADSEIYSNKEKISKGRIGVSKPKQAISGSAG